MHAQLWRGRTDDSLTVVTVGDRAEKCTQDHDYMFVSRARSEEPEAYRRGGETPWTTC